MEDLRWLGALYGDLDLPPRVEDDYVATRRAMVEAIAKDHLPSPDDLHDDDGVHRMAHAVAFLDPYATLFTTNYDLLLYWTLMRRVEAGRSAVDGFIRSRGHDYGQFRPLDRIDVLYLHGALHLYEVEGRDGRARIRKRIRREDESLPELVQRMLEEDDLPLVVAEGRPDQKARRLAENPYLAHCLDRLRAVDGDLVVFGHSLGPSDTHLLDALAENPTLRRLWIGLYRDSESSSNLALRGSVARLVERRRECLPDAQLDVAYYDSATAPVWTAQAD